MQQMDGHEPDVENGMRLVALAVQQDRASLRPRIEQLEARDTSAVVGRQPERLTISGPGCSPGPLLKLSRSGVGFAL